MPRGRVQASSVAHDNSEHCRALLAGSQPHLFRGMRRRQASIWHPVTELPPHPQPSPAIVVELSCPSTGLIQAWPAVDTWAGPDGLQRLRELCGEATVQVTMRQASFACSLPQLSSTGVSTGPGKCYTAMNEASCCAFVCTM